MGKLKDGWQKVTVEEKNVIYFGCVKQYWITIMSGTHQHGYCRVQPVTCPKMLLLLTNKSVH